MTPKNKKNIIVPTLNPIPIKDLSKKSAIANVFGKKTEFNNPRINTETTPVNKNPLIVNLYFLK